MTDSYTFWKNMVDTIMVRTIGLASDDVEDWYWRDYYEDGFTPAETVEEWIIANA